MLVEVVPSPVVPSCRSWVGAPCGILHVSEAGSGIPLVPSMVGATVSVGQAGNSHQHRHKHEERLGDHHTGYQVRQQGKDPQCQEGKGHSTQG